MNTLIDPYNRRATTEEQKIYDHLLTCVQSESPSQLLNRFRMLFIDGIGYSEPEIWSSLQQIVNSKLADQEFVFILNRCCHILINRWQLQPQHQKAIADLVDLFKAPSERYSPTATFRTRSGRRLQELIQQFRESEQYLTLYRLVQVVDRDEDQEIQKTNRPLGTLIRRYPYLYPHCLLSDDSSYEHEQTVRQLQAQRQQEYEVNLSQYVTYQVRRAQTNRKSSSSNTAARLIQPVPNPTLLGDRELYFALKHYLGKVEGSYTYRDLANSFLTHTSQSLSYRNFKDDLYEYLTSSIDLEYGKRQFNERLYKQLQSTLPQSDAQKFSDFLLVRTCSQLLNFLVVESPNRPQHFVFIDLISNIGTQKVTGLLLKIVLLCRKVKPYLEKRFSILFSHYELSTHESVMWLVKMLENLNVAFSTHFGAVDLSFVSQIV